MLRVSGTANFLGTAHRTWQVRVAASSTDVGSLGAAPLADRAW